jgi:hypothetical protein
LEVNIIELDYKTVEDAARYQFLRDGNISRLEFVADEYGVLDFYSGDALDQEVDNLILSAAR